MLQESIECDDRYDVEYALIMPQTVKVEACQIESGDSINGRRAEDYRPPGVYVGGCLATRGITLEA